MCFNHIHPLPKLLLNHLHFPTHPTLCPHALPPSYPICAAQIFLDRLRCVAFHQSVVNSTGAVFLRNADFPSPHSLQLPIALPLRVGLMSTFLWMSHLALAGVNHAVTIAMSSQYGCPVVVGGPYILIVGHPLCLDLPVFLFFSFGKDPWGSQRGL